MQKERPIVELVQGVLHRAGAHLSRYPERSEFESVLHDFLVGFDVGCVIDVGANVGGYARGLRGLGYAGRIVSFEPVSGTFAQLREIAAGDALWETHRMALGPSDGEAPMRVFPGHQNSTFSRPGEFAREWLPSALAEEHVENVPLRRLDTLLADGTLDPGVPTLLKVDAEGYDWSVIEGAGERIRDFVGVQMELMVQPMWENARPLGESVTRLAEMGFEPVSFSVVNRARFSAIVIDGLFRNRRFAPKPGSEERMWNPAGMGLAPQQWDAAARAEADAVAARRTDG
ncbi:MAG TPA: FkbM family methyltransferase [Longimicrobium sp.]|nr:FkbM family methyltransferase [Longimicrobium sp.]